MIRSKDTYVGKKIRIIKIWTKGELYKNLTPSSIHKIIKSPGITKNSSKGVWVMGNGGHAYIEKKEFNFTK